jgi:phosphate transport system substrate-binding protein
VLSRPGIPSLVLATLALVVAACGGAQPPQSSGPAAACFPVTGRCPDEATSLNAGGATFPAVIYTKWIDEYNRLTGVQVNYQSIGSGGGIKGITDRTFDFAASDAPMTDKQLADAKSPILHVPTVLGAVVPTYNLPGVSGTVRLTSDTLAGIFLGEIRKWNDPKLAAANPGTTLPDKDIVIVHRSDGSGTTFVFTDYLSKVSPAWKAKVGAGTSVEWPVGVGGKGNEGVAAAVKSTPYAIGYVELIYALQQKLGAVRMQNASGAFVDATLDSVSKAAVGVTLPDDLRVSITNSPNPEAWPISSFTYLLIYRDSADHAKALAIARFAWWGTHDGQQYAKDLGYAPLPTDVQPRVEAKIRSIAASGEPVLPAK